MRRGRVEVGVEGCLAARDWGDSKVVAVRLPEVWAWWVTRLAEKEKSPSPRRRIFLWGERGRGIEGWEREWGFDLGLGLGFEEGVEDFGLGFVLLGGGFEVGLR